MWQMPFSFLKFCQHKFCFQILWSNFLWWILHFFLCYFCESQSLHLQVPYPKYKVPLLFWCPIQKPKRLVKKNINCQSPQFLQFGDFYFWFEYVHFHFLFETKCAIIVFLFSLFEATSLSVKQNKIVFFIANKF